MVFSLKKQKIIKRIPFIPPPHPLKPKQKNEQKKISLFERKVKKKEPSALFVCPAPEKGRKLQEGDQLRENQKNMTTLY